MTRVLDPGERDTARRALVSALRELDHVDIEWAHDVVLDAVGAHSEPLPRMTTARLLVATGWRRVYPILPANPEMRYARTSA